MATTTHDCPLHVTPPARAPAADDACAHDAAPVPAGSASPASGEGSCAHPTDPFAVLDGCHRHVLATLEQLEAAVRELVTGDAFTPRVLATLADTFVVLDVGIPMHSADEEQTLFPRLRARQPFAGAPHTPMDCMEQEHVTHRELGLALKRGVLRRDVAATARAARHLIAEYRDHIAKEDEILFPMARQVLGDPAVRAEMLEEMLARRAAEGLLGC